MVYGPSGHITGFDLCIRVNTLLQCSDRPSGHTLSGLAMRHIITVLPRGSELVCLVTATLIKMTK